MGEHENTLKPGDTLGIFVIGELLGAGGMGEVYRARDTKLERDVAVKVLRLLASCPEGDARFQREARLLASLNHPNIASIYGFDEVDSIRFIVLEIVEGHVDPLIHGSLEDLDDLASVVGPVEISALELEIADKLVDASRAAPRPCSTCWPTP